MTDTLLISELASRSGFSTSALRYYERMGLLAAADRSPSGYRLFHLSDPRGRAELDVQGFRFATDLRRDGLQQGDGVFLGVSLRRLVGGSPAGCGKPA